TTLGVHMIMFGSVRFECAMEEIYPNKTISSEEMNVIGRELSKDYVFTSDDCDYNHGFISENNYNDPSSENDPNDMIIM
ncbi:26215_t:CDS:2, partial [Racocetra persica]